MIKRIDFIKNIAIKAGEIIISFLDKAEVNFKENKNNFVTQADLSAEKFIIDEIKKHFPEDCILSEESSTDQIIANNSIWIIDPLDGTNNFSRSIPQFCVSIAYANKGEVLFAAIFDPMRNELFWAEKGKGAYLNDNQIQVSSRISLDEAIVATGFYYDRGKMMADTLESIKRLFQAEICGLRRMGSAALDLCWLACSRYDAYFEYKLHPWDFAAGLLILIEAKGKACDKYGNIMTLTGEGIIASNAHLQKSFLELVKCDLD